MKEKVKELSLFGIVNEYLPSKSVEVPIVVPFTITVAPGSGLLYSSNTTPLTSLVALL